MIYHRPPLLAFQIGGKQNFSPIDRIKGGEEGFRPFTLEKIISS